MNRFLVNLFFGIEMIANMVKLFLYALVAIWIFFYLKVIDVSDEANTNEIILKVSNVLNNNILVITATIAILEVIAHLINFQSILKSHDETIRKLDEDEERKNKRKFELMLKNPKDKTE